MTWCLFTIWTGRCRHRFASRPIIPAVPRACHGLHVVAALATAQLRVRLPFSLEGLSTAMTTAWCAQRCSPGARKRGPGWRAPAGRQTRMQNFASAADQACRCTHEACAAASYLFFSKTGHLRPCPGPGFAFAWCVPAPQLTTTIRGLTIAIYRHCCTA